MNLGNRFSLLRIDDDDEHRGDPKGASNNQNQSNSAAKKKNKKKNKEAEGNLRSLAFGLPPRPGTGKQHKGQQQQKHGNKQQAANEGGKGYEAWVERDKQWTDEAYEHDVQEATMLSKLAHEQEIEARRREEAEMRAAGITVTTNGGGSKDSKKKKKKKEKPQAMSLDQFQQLPAEQVQGSDDEDETENVPPRPHVNSRIPEGKQDTHFFDDTEKQAISIAEKERTKEQYQKAYSQQQVMQSKYMDQLKAKDREIVELHQKLADQQALIKETKQRNEVLYKLMAHGEMKDKAALSEQVEQLTQVRDELTEQVANLNEELQKERSKVHALKLEAEKMKGKHGK